MANRPAKHSLADLNRAVKAASKHPGATAVEARPDGTLRIIIGDDEKDAKTINTEEEFKL